MSNLKISQLPSYTGNTSGSWLVMNNSGETTTYKVQRENLLSGFQPSGSYATLGSNRFNGNQTITGSLLVSGSAGEGTTLISGNVIQTNLGLVVASVFASTGQVNLFADGTNNDVQIRAAGTGSILLQNRTTITGSLTVSGSAAGLGNGLNVIGNTLLSGSVIINGSSAAGTKYLFFSSASGSAGAIIAYNTSGELSILQSNTGSCRLELGNTSGTNTMYGDTTITGSVNISEVMTLAKQNPLPTGTTGSLAVSGSGLYFHNGTSWNLIS
jgi:hypothetical protein